MYVNNRYWVVYQTVIHSTLVTTYKVLFEPIVNVIGNGEFWPTHLRIGSDFNEISRHAGTTNCVRPDYDRSKCRIQTCGEAVRQHSSTLLHQVELSVRQLPKSTCKRQPGRSRTKMDWSAPQRQRSQSDSHSGDRLYRSRSLDGDATVQANFTLTTTSRLRRPTGVILPSRSLPNARARSYSGRKLRHTKT